MRHLLSTILLLCSLPLVSCSEGSPTEPSSCVKLSGAWRVQLQNGCAASWSWTDQVNISQNACAFHGDASLTHVSFDGTASASSVAVQFTFSGPCAGAATGTGSIGLDGVIGTYQGNVSGGPGCCGGPVAGSFYLLPPE